MTLPRFHLSTLLLLCVFAGACVGLRLSPSVWKEEKSILEGVPATGIGYTVTAVAFDSTGTRLFVGTGGSYLLDVKSKQILWRKPVSEWTITSAKFVERDTEVHFFFSYIPYSLPERFLGELYLRTEDGTENWLRRRASSYSAIQSQNDISVTSPDGTETVRFYEPFAASIYGRGDAETPICKLRLRGGHLHCAAYSPDGQYLALGDEYGMTLYRRTRGYGWTGWLRLPLFWAAAAALVALIFIFAPLAWRKARPSAIH